MRSPSLKDSSPSSSASSGYMATTKLCFPGVGSGFFGGARSLRYTVSQGSEMGRPSRLYVEASCDAAGGLYSTRVGGRVFVVAEGEWR